MKKTLLFVIILIGFTANTQNAQGIIDGLKKNLKANPDEKKRTTFYTDIGFYYGNISIYSAVFYVKKAIAKIEKINDYKIIPQVYSNLKAVYFRKIDFFISSENHYLSIFLF